MWQIFETVIIKIPQGVIMNMVVIKWKNRQFQQRNRSIEKEQIQNENYINRERTSSSYNEWKISIPQNYLLPNFILYKNSEITR